MLYGTGCQTILVQGTDGTVFLAYTEEWGVSASEARVLQNHAAWSTFTNTDGQSLQAFTGYPGSLPGSSFFMTKKTIAAVDSLEQNPENQFMVGVPAALTTWLCWYLGDTVDALKIIETVGLHSGGYALNQIALTNEGPQARTIEFVGNETAVQTLESAPLSHLVHTNRIEDAALAKKWGAPVLEYGTYYENVTYTHTRIREGWAKRFHNAVPNAPALTLQSLQKEIALIPFATHSKKLAAEQTTNGSTICTFVASLSPDGVTHAIVSAGPQIGGESIESSRIEIQLN